MKTRFRRASAAVLVLSVCLTLAPIAVADGRDGGRDLGERVRRIFQKIQQIVGTIGTNSDIPAPPKP